MTRSTNLDSIVGKNEEPRTAILNAILILSIAMNWTTFAGIEQPCIRNIIQLVLALSEIFE